jgi:hypothetical protein
MGCTSRIRSTRRHAWWTGVLVLLSLGSGIQAAQAQSCVGKVAGDVCRPSAGACDVAETCVPTGGNPGAPLYQPADGSLATNVAWSYTMGYAFTPSQVITVTSLGGYFNGTRTVYLYDRTTGAVLASATVTAANSWAYAPITPVTLTKLMPYSVAVDLAGSGGAYRTSMSSLPSVAAAATIDGSCYRYASTAEPCATSGLIAGTNYGMADLKYVPAQPLYQPTDGTLYTDAAGDYTVGYAFTPNKNLTVTHLGGLFNGTRTVYLYNRSTGALLASVSSQNANGWAYKTIPPMTLTAGTSYTVAVYWAGSGGAYRTGMTSMPSVLADATIEGTCYRPSNTAEPCAYSGLIAGINSGMADIKYTATGGGGLACPADSLVSAGSVCRAAGGSCDVAETCTGTSAACPANAFVAAGVSCNDGQLCTYNDVCNGAGSCGGTTVTCGGGNACSTTVCNGTNTCDVAKVFCESPPSECYNTLGSCNTANGSCSYTVKVGAPCGTHGTCLSSGVCNPGLPITTLSVPADCATQTIPAPTPIGCDSCDASKPCIVDSIAYLPVEYQTCSGYTPRKGDVVLHEAVGLTQLLVANFGSNWTHVGVFLDPQPANASQQQKEVQEVRHQALNLDGLAQAVIQPGKLDEALIALSFNASSAYCKSAKLNPALLLDSGQFIAGVPNSHTGDMVKEQDGNGTLFWEDGVVNRTLVLAANRATGEDVANRMLLRDDYYSLNSLLDEAKGMTRLSGNKPGTNCASEIMSCITPTVAPTLLTTDKIRSAAEKAYQAIRHQVRWMQKTNDAVTTCKIASCIFVGCSLDCDGIAWETANGIADQVIACILFGPTSAGCDCTRDNRKWHYAAWAGAAPTAPTQDDLDWVNHRLTDPEFLQDPWTGSAAAGQPVTTIYQSYSYLPGDVMSSVNYPPSNAYPLIRKTNAMRQYGHCNVPLTLTATMSPATSPYGTTITWTATATGGDPATIQYAFFRRPSGNIPWTPVVTSPAWQASNVFSWTPAAADAGSWDTYVWVKDGNTPPTANTYGYAAGFNTGGVLVSGPNQVYPAKGWVDGFNTQHIWGWACDPDYPAQSNRVDFWSTSGQGLGSAGANLASNAGVTSACLGGTAHGFDFYPSGGIPSGTHFNVWSIDLPYATPGNDNRKCGGTGSIGDGTEFVVP